MATASAAGLIDADPTDPVAIRILQNEARLYLNTVHLLRMTVERADEAERVAKAEMPAEEQEALFEAVMGNHSSADAD